MRATLLAAIALIVGTALGLFLTQREFSNENAPVDLTLTSGGSATKRPTKIGPKATIVNSERHDFGAMDRNSHGKHAYIVRNDGDAPLTIKTGQPSCGVCIKVFEAEKETLQPGEKCEVRIEWDVKTSDAEFEQSGPITTNDPKRPTITLYIRGKAIDKIRFDRSDLHFHDLSTNEEASGSINMYVFKDVDLQVEKHQINNQALAKFFDISFSPLTADELAREPNAKGGMKVNVDVKPGLPYGDFNEPVEVWTNQNTEAPLTFRLIGNVASDILLMGPAVTREKSLVNLGGFSGSEGKKHTIYLIVKGPYRDQTKIDIKSEEPATQFSAKLGEPIHDTPKTTRYPITIEIPAGAAPVSRLDGAKIHVTTTHPDVKEMTIKVRYVVKE